MTNTSTTYSGLGIGAAVKSVLNKYGNFNDRATRSEFWWWYLFQIIIAVVLGILFGISAASVNSDGSLGGFTIFVIILYVIWGLGIIVPTIAVTVRRLHDAGFSGWLYLLNIIPAGSLVVLILSLLPSKPEANQWGSAPTPAQ